MAKKFTDLVAASSAADSDIIAIVAVATDTSKKITKKQFLAGSIGSDELKAKALQSWQDDTFWAGVTTGQTNVGTSNYVSKTAVITLPVEAFIYVEWVAAGNANAAGDPGVSITVDGSNIVARTGSGGLELLGAALNEDYPFSLTGISGVLAAGSHTITFNAIHSVASGWDLSAGTFMIKAFDGAHYA